MADILLTLPNDLQRALEVEASRLGRTAEDIIRAIIESNVPRSTGTSTVSSSLQDEPIVQAAAIEIECRRLGYEYGWRFITCPEKNAANAKLLLISLNPAGREVHGPSWSQEEGSAYRIEAWGTYRAGQAPLQRQILAMFSLLGLRDDEVFSAHYVPFRSPSWAELAHSREAEAFSQRLWQRLIPALSFERIVCVGKDKPGKPMARLFKATFEGSLAVGWGNVTADRYRLPSGQPLIALPHLSRFGIFGRTEGCQALNNLFDLNGKT